ncbi:hypothetical protein MRB53_029225 [Persea americana]|uniref:Uncharacterized protein n=1 Tax=Persea americana TaxID=3435 RepID=A0ACC2KHU7_PERAE|nr:hypothetical protein MRB53_029225 [Persea americana]
MENFAPPAVNPISDAADDGCSICLEQFSADDPATVTNCKHEYHLQCILDWSQRSKECPICWQLLALKDPESQQLLAAVEIEKNSRSRRISSNSSTFRRIPPEDFEFHNVPSFADESDLDERIVQHLAAAAISRAHHLRRRERHRSSALAQSQSLVFAAPSNASDVEQVQETSPSVGQDTGTSVLPEAKDDAPTVVLSPATVEQRRASFPIFPESMSSDVVDNTPTPLTSRITASQTPPASPQTSRPSEFLSFSESLKSKLSAASSRYKESISKSTRGFKEKLLARNTSVKELSKEVQREVTAGIAGVARMMERLDPTSKRVGGFTSVSSGTVGTSESFPRGERVPENLIIPNKTGRGTAQATSSNLPIHASGPLSSSREGFVGVAHVQDSL